MTDEELLLWLRVEDTNLTDFAANRIEALVNEAVLSKAAYEGVSYLLLSVQQDCIKERQRAERLEAALRLLHDNVVLAFPTLANLGPVANARATLLTEKPPTEYERKVAQMKEDFPNGI